MTKKGREKLDLSYFRIGQPARRPRMIGKLAPQESSDMTRDGPEMCVFIWVYLGALRKGGSGKRWRAAVVAERHRPEPSPRAPGALVLLFSDPPEGRPA